VQSEQANWRSWEWRNATRLSRLPQDRAKGRGQWIGCEDDGADNLSLDPIAHSEPVGTTTSTTPIDAED
jgi:hypothetical protein